MVDKDFFEEKDVRDEIDDLDDFDLEDVVGDESETSEESSQEEMIPKSRAREIVQKRLARERNKMKAFEEQFREVYGLSPEEVLEFGRREIAKYRTSAGTHAGWPATVASGPGSGGAGDKATVDESVRPGASKETATTDPVVQKVLDLERRLIEMDTARQLEREAADFVRRYPGVRFEDIPPEVLQRRAMGGVTLAEAYKLYMADKEAVEAAKRAAEETARNIKAREKVRAEGADYSGGTDEGAGSLTQEEREFARTWGMTPKEFLAYKYKVQKLKEKEGAES